MIRCITAIWPAGPPKLSSATRVHTRNASPRETPCAALAADLFVAVSSVGKIQLCALAGAFCRPSCRLRRRRDAGPIVDFIHGDWRRDIWRGSVHAQPPRHASDAQSLDGIRLMGSLLFPNEESRLLRLRAQAIFRLVGAVLRLAGFTPRRRSVRSPIRV